MASWMTNSAFRCTLVPVARLRYGVKGPGGFVHSGAAGGGQRVPIFLEASVCKRRR